MQALHPILNLNFHFKKKERKEKIKCANLRNFISKKTTHLVTAASKCFPPASSTGIKAKDQCFYYYFQNCP